MKNTILFLLICTGFSLNSSKRIFKLVLQDIKQLHGDQPTLVDFSGLDVTYTHKGYDFNGTFKYLADLNDSYTVGVVSQMGWDRFMYDIFEIVPMRFCKFITFVYPAFGQQMLVEGKTNFPVVEEHAPCPKVKGEYYVKDGPFQTISENFLEGMHFYYEYGFHRITVTFRNDKGIVGGMYILFFYEDYWN